MGKYNDIKAGSKLNISGFEDTVIKGLIGQGAKISNRGSGNLKINGTVCENVSINMSGSGDLKINGTVRENVFINMSGSGDLIFSQRPPQSVIDKISKTGSGSLKIPGGYSQSSKKSSNKKKRKYTSTSSSSSSSDSDDSYSGGSSYNNIITGIVSKHGGSIVSSDGLIKVTKDGITTTYAGNSISSGRNGKPIIDNKEVTDNDPRILHVEAASRNNSSIVINDGNSINIYGNRIGNFEEEESEDNENNDEESRSEDDRVDHKAKRQKTEDDPLDKYSEDTEAYIDSWRQKKPTNTDLLKDFQLTEEEEKLLEPYMDPILITVPNIPVKIFGKRYDLDTILSLDKQIEPITKYKFTKRDIASDREGAEELEKRIQQIKTAHEEKNNAQPEGIKNTR